MKLWYECRNKVIIKLIIYVIRTSEGARVKVTLSKCLVLRVGDYMGFTCDMKIFIASGTYQITQLLAP